MKSNALIFQSGNCYAMSPNNFLSPHSCLYHSRTVKSCGRLDLPARGQVYLPCYSTFGSRCTLGCMDGYFGVGSNLATCRLTNSSEVKWDIGNFTCEG